MSKPTISRSSRFKLNSEMNNQKNVCLVHSTIMEWKITPPPLRLLCVKVWLLNEFGSHRTSGKLIQTNIVYCRYLEVITTVHWLFMHEWQQLLSVSRALGQMCDKIYPFWWVKNSATNKLCTEKGDEARIASFDGGSIDRSSFTPLYNHNSLNAYQWWKK